MSHLQAVLVDEDQADEAVLVPGRTATAFAGSATQPPES